MISFGNIKAKAVYYGGLAIKAVYAGAVKVWEKVAGLKNYIIKGNASVVDGKVKGVGDEFQFNQLHQDRDVAENVAGGVTNSCTGHTARISGTCTAWTSVFNYSQAINNAVIDHKYMILLVGLKNSLQVGYSNIGGGDITISGNDSFRFFTATRDSIGVLYLRFKSGVTYNDTFTMQLFDLTAMGIADRVNSLADFKAYLVERGMMQSVDDELPYFAYDAGSTKTSMPIVARSANLWDEEWELGTFDTTNGHNVESESQIRFKNPITIKANTQYYCSKGSQGGNCWAMFFDANMNVIPHSTGSQHVNNVSQISNTIFTTPNGCKYIKAYLTSGYGTTYNHDICISEGATSVGYVPYYRKTCPCVLSAPLFKVGNVADAAEFATQKVTRAFAKIVFNGSESWEMVGLFFQSPTISALKVVDQNVASPLLCADYVVEVARYGSASTSVADKTIRNKGAYANVFVKDVQFSTLAEWKEHLAEHPLEVIYELATPIVEDAVLPQVTEWQDGYILTTDTEIAPSEVTTEV